LKKKNDFSFFLYLRNKRIITTREKKMQTITQRYVRKISKRALHRAPIRPFGDECRVHIKGVEETGKIELFPYEPEPIVEERPRLFGMVRKDVEDRPTPLQDANQEKMVTTTTTTHRPMPSGPTPDIRVSNLSPNTLEADILYMFRQFGEIHKLYLSRDDRGMGDSRGFAFVSFIRLQDSIAANSKLDQTGWDHLILKIDYV
jgi:hypothetical protein